MFPERGPCDPFAVMRAKRDPPDWAMVALGPKFVLSEETSKPVGAVAVIEAVRFVPLTVMDCEAEALPAVVEKAVKVPVVVMRGADGSTTVKEPELVPDSLPTVTVMGPVEAPTGTAAVRLEPLLNVTLVAAVPLKETVALEAKFVPVMVTEVPTEPEVGEMLVIVGAVEEEGETRPETTMSLPVPSPGPPLPLAASANE